MERQEMSYLNPESLSEEEAKRICAPDTAEDGRELAFAHSALESIRKKDARLGRPSKCTTGKSSNFNQDSQGPA
jgi:hypothetical protein